MLSVTHIVIIFGYIIINNKIINYNGEFMNTNEEYNKHLQDFYSATFREFALKNGIGENKYGPVSSEAQSYTDHMLSLYGAAINEGMAYELLNKIEMNSPTSLQKLENYPSMFWQTRNGKDTLENISREVNKSQTSFLFDKDDLSQEDIMASWKVVVDMAKKIAFKDSTIGYHTVQNFTEEFVNCLKAKIEHKGFSDKKLLHSGYMKALESITDSTNDFKVPAFYSIERHLNAVKSYEIHNATIMSIPINNNKMKM